MGQWTLSNLLAPFLQVEYERYNAAVINRSQPASRAASVRSLRQTISGGMGNTPNEDEKPEKKSRLRRLFTLKKDAPRPNGPAEPVRAPTPEPEQGDEEEAPTPVQYKEVFDNVVKTRRLNLLAPIDAPLVTMPPGTRFIISELADQGGAPTCVYGQELGRLHEPEQVARVINELPGWVGEVVLRGKLPQRHISKIGFLVSREGEEGENAEKSRLMANPILRARKIMTYVVKQQVQSGRLPESALASPPDSLLRLYCQDQVIPSDMMLSFIRTRVWRAGGEVQIRFQLIEETKQ